MVFKRTTDRANRKIGVTDFDALLKAIKEIKIDNKSLRATCKAYNIPRTSMSRYVGKLDAKFPDISAVNDAALIKELRSMTSLSERTQVNLILNDSFQFFFQWIKYCLFFFVCRFSMRSKRRFWLAIF